MCDACFCDAQLLCILSESPILLETQIREDGFAEGHVMYLTPSDSGAPGHHTGALTFTDVTSTSTGTYTSTYTGTSDQHSVLETQLHNPCLTLQLIHILVCTALLTHPRHWLHVITGKLTARSTSTCYLMEQEKLIIAETVNWRFRCEIIALNHDCLLLPS